MIPSDTDAASPDTADLPILSLLDAATRDRVIFSLRLLLIGTLIVLLLQPFLAPEQTRRALFMGGIAVTIGLALWLTHRGRMHAAVMTTLLGCWLVITAGAIVNGAVFSASLFAYPLIIAAAGWVLNFRAALLFGVATVVAEGALALAGGLGLIGLAPASPLWQWLVHGMLVAATIAFVGFSVRAYADRLHHIRRLSRELAEKVRAIEQREAALARQAAQYRALLDAQAAAGVGLFIIRDNRVTYATSAVCQLFGYREAEILALPSYLDLVHPDDRMRVAENHRRRLRGDAADHRYELAVLTASGERREIETTAALLLEDPTRSVLVIVTDITERRRAEAEVRRFNSELEERVRRRTHELTEANEELESFAYSISHDLRAPLRGIDGFSRLLDEEYGNRLDGQGRDYLARVRRASQRMGTLIDNLLELSRVTRQEMRGVPVDLSAIAREVTANLRIDEPQRVVAVRIADGCHTVGDPQLLRVLLENLLGNAWKYTAKTTQAEIEFAVDTVGAGETAFHVRDNGAGFDMSYVDKLFAPFQRLHSPSEFEGSGIGLASAWRVVRRHGGQIHAEAAPGRGATFHVTLPQPLRG